MVNRNKRHLILLYIIYPSSSVQQNFTEIWPYMPDVTTDRKVALRQSPISQRGSWREKHIMRIVWYYAECCEGTKETHLAYFRRIPRLSGATAKSWWVRRKKSLYQNRRWWQIFTSTKLCSKGTLIIKIAWLQVKSKWTFKDHLGQDSSINLQLCQWHLFYSLPLIKIPLKNILLGTFSHSRRTFLLTKLKFFKLHTTKSKPSSLESTVISDHGNYFPTALQQTSSLSSCYFPQLSRHIPRQYTPCILLHEKAKRFLGLLNTSLVLTYPGESQALTEATSL